MQIAFIACPEQIEEKIESKHNVTCREARQVFFTRPRVRFVEKGHTEGEDVYVAFGQTRGVFYLQAHDQDGNHHQRARYER